uniref:glycosyltransferase family 2 protein n=1 Tax=Sphingomonas sp. TaxID=28214 RepID=UPI00286C81C4
MIVILLMLLAIPFLVTAYFVVEVAAGLPRMPRRDLAPALPGRVALVMPAHDEAAIIGDIIATLRPSLEGWASLLVVADNCVDPTADIARAAGASVIERSSATERGKGFALAFAQQYLRSDPPDVVIILDADCGTDRTSLQLLAGSASALGRPCQTVNLIRPDRSASPLVQLSSFAFMLKNLVRQRGLQRLARRVHLTGTGMALPWSLFDQAPLASANIVEDVELGLRMERLGYPPQLVSDATVWSDPSSASGTLIQRTRWEGGFLAMATVQAPHAIARAIGRGDRRALAAALDLAVPPLTLLALIDAAVLLVAVALTLISGAPWWPVALH